jgi:hypothetical protein
MRDSLEHVKRGFSDILGAQKRIEGLPDMMKVEQN